MHKVWNVISTYSLLLLTGAALALIWANLDNGSYQHLVHFVLWDHAPIGLLHEEGGTVTRQLTLHFLINDICMAFFFAIAAKEVWEGIVLQDGELRHSRDARGLHVLTLNSPARQGDALGLNALKTQGTEYQRLSYSVPVGYDGWRAGVHASHLNYQVVAAEFASLNPYGTATTRGLDLSYPVLRSQLQNINFALSYDDKSFDNTSNGATTSYGIKVFNASVSASLIDSWQGGGMTNASIAVTSGDKYTEARYKKINLSLSRLQSLSETLSVYVAASAQTTNANLDSSEKMYLGGATGVRAYPASEAGGSAGNTLTLELRQRLDNNVTLTGFYDYGRVKVNRDNAVASPANPNDYNLQGYGVTLAWQAAQAVDLKATVAQRMGSNPNANTTTGMDADGTKKITRLWLSSGVAF